MNPQQTPDTTPTVNPASAPSPTPITPAPVSVLPPNKKGVPAAVIAVVAAIVVLVAGYFIYSSVIAKKPAKSESTKTSTPAKAGNSSTAAVKDPAICLTNNDFADLPGSFIESSDNTNPDLPYHQNYIFQADSTQLLADQTVPYGKDLDALAAFYKKHSSKQMAFEVQGGANAGSSDSVGTALASKRADAITAELVTRGIPATMIKKLDPFHPIEEDVNSETYKADLRSVKVSINPTCSSAAITGGNR